MDGLWRLNRASVRRQVRSAQEILRGARGCSQLHGEWESSPYTYMYNLNSLAQMITEGKLYTGSSDGTLRVWNAKDVSEELL